jgi:hypothetical protein
MIIAVIARHKRDTERIKGIALAALARKLIEVNPKSAGTPRALLGMSI